MKVFWTEPAVRDWEASFHYIESENQAAAQRLTERLLETVEMLALHPYAGHIGRLAGVREFTVPRSTFIIAYSVHPLENALHILAVHDGRRRWPKSFPAK
jgi:addiction module RelE/StbE family toxin